MKKVEFEIECKSCKGTGVYSGMGECDDVALICHTCKGKGHHLYSFSYNEFTGRKKNPKIKRVYLSGYGYKIGTGIITFKKKEEEISINMDEKGVSYYKFLKGEMPVHIKELACPLMADQKACHNIKGFVDRCNYLNGGWISMFTECVHQCHKDECWLRFEK